MQKKKKNLLAIDDHPIILEALERIIQRHIQDVEVLTASSKKEALQLAASHKPDFVFLDIKLKDTDGLELIRHIRAVSKKSKIVIFTGYAAEEACIMAIKYGADGIITKDMEPKKIINAINTLTEDKMVIPEELMTIKVLRALQNKEQDGSTDDIENLLSTQEFTIWRLTGEGKTTKDIAHQLSISEKTILTYKERIKEKLKLKSSADLNKEAIKWAISKKIT